MNAFILDAPTGRPRRRQGLANAVTIIQRLVALSGTQAQLGGRYREDTTLCQIMVQTPMTERELDNWLWGQKGIDYIGLSQYSGSH